MTTSKVQTIQEKLKSLPLGTTAPAVVVQKNIKTAPGALGQFMAEESKVFAENRSMAAELEQIKSNRHPSTLPAHVIFPSMYANRSEESFKGPDFQSLLDEISDAGRNIQPIKVRPMAASGGEREQHYEIVFGHRRHRACSILNCEVLVVVEELDDQKLFEQMDRENRNRVDLRAYEQGVMYLKALDAGLYRNIHQLCKATGANPGNAGMALRLAKLDVKILQAFAYPTDIQFAWINPLLKSVDANPQLATQRAEEICTQRDQGRLLSPKEIFIEMTKTEDSKMSREAGDAQVFESNGNKVAIMKKHKSGYLVEFEKDVLTAQRAEKLTSFLKELFA